ncbi:hypothetical protein ABZ776_37275, partial [Streptomyces sp. NPDC007076]|uniref:hypothetical protein n=1 Tax=Streptomyces sp. NPDC007076 TaxID=3160975 RepID=UPI0033C4C906
LAFLLLMVVFRSLLVPLKAALGFLLSVAAAFSTMMSSPCSAASAYPAFWFPPYPRFLAS